MGGVPSRTERLVGFVEAIPALLRLGRGPSKPINHLPQCLCAAATPFACGAIQLKLRVCTRSACEDVARSANLVDTIEGLGIFAEQREEVIEHRLDRLRGVAFTFTHDKTRGSAVTMSAPYVLLGNCAVDHVDIGVEARIMSEMPYEAAIKGGEADCILNARADIGNAQLKRCLAEGSPPMAIVGRSVCHERLDA